MRAHRIAAASAVIALLSVAPAMAHHVVWLDFSQFNLNSWTSVNGNNPPTASDTSAVREQIIANMHEDYAPFDIYFTRFQPTNGRYTRVIFYGAAAPGGLFGCAGASCCQNGNCSGIGSWDSTVASDAEVYCGSFAGDTNFSGANATTARIASGLSGTASHELGHVLDLRHCHSADDFVGSGASCSDGYGSTSDLNVNWHIMASGLSTGLSMPQRATRNRFFSIHSSRRVFFDNFQARNHWDPLGNVNGGVGRSDLSYGRIGSPSIVRWFVRTSTSSSFGSWREWAADRGQRADIFLTGDVTGDGRDDLVIGRVQSRTRVQWFVSTSTGKSFPSAPSWVSDAGDAGDIFRLADVNNDGRDDLVYGRPSSSSTVRWFARLSTGSSFGGFTTWSTDAGRRSSLFLIGDVTGDGRADLVAVNRGSFGGTKVYRSTGSSFVFDEDDSMLGLNPEYVMLGDADGDGRADLITGEVKSNTRVDWDVRESNGCSGFLVTSCFRNADRWRSDAGDAGDLFRIGDGNADGRMDLYYGRHRLMTSLTTTPNLTQIRWYGRLSTGSSFGGFTTWASDAGDEGDLFP
jgi:hypothetical protein